MSLLFDFGAEVTASGSVVVPPGHHRIDERMTLSRAVTVRGGPGAVLDAQHRHGVLRIDAPGQIIRLQHLAFENAFGAAVEVVAGTVLMQGCSFSSGRAPQFGGAGVLARGGDVELRGCTFMMNAGRQGGALLADGDAGVRVYDSVFAFNGAAQGGAVRVRGGAAFEAVGCTFAQNRALAPGDAAAPGATFRVEGTTSRPSRFTLVNCLVAAHESSTQGELHAGPHSEVTLRHCWLPAPIDGVSQTGCRFGPVSLTQTLAPVEAHELADAQAWADARSTTHDGAPRTGTVGAFNAA